MMTTVLMINVHSCRNAGDAALTLVAIEQLQRHFPGCRIELAMDDPDSHSGDETTIGSFFTWVKSSGKWQWFGLAWLLPATILPLVMYRLVGRPLFFLTPRRWRALLQAYLDADLVVSKPGGFLYSSGSGLSLLIGLYTLWLAIFAGKPLYIFPQSVGPFSRAWERWLAGVVLRGARIVMVREEISLKQLRACRLPPEKCRLLPDVAFAFTGVPAETAASWLKEWEVDIHQQMPYLGMTIIDWGIKRPGFERQNEYERACAAAIRHFVSSYEGRVLLFSQVWGPLENQDDRIPARRVAESLSDLGDAVVVVDSPTTPGMLRSAYQFMDIFVGTRMHSNIFALSGGVPVIGVGYLPKTQGIMQMAGIDEWFIGINEVTPDLLVQMLEQLWTTRETVRSCLAETLPRLIAEARRAGEIIASDFRELER